MAEIPGATYLGDGLYATKDPNWGQVELFAHNGLTKTNRVFLDPEVLVRFLAWLKDEGLVK